MGHISTHCVTAKRPITVAVAEPDPEGIQDIELAAQESGYLDGFIGPIAVVRRHAEAEHVQSIPEGRGGLIGLLAMVYVEVHLRGGGLGTTLVRRFLTEAAARKVGAIYLCSLPSDELGFDLTQWYERLGFRRLDAMARFAGPVMFVDLAAAQEVSPLPGEAAPIPPIPQ